MANIRGDDAIVSYDVLPDETLIWAVTRRGLRLVRQLVTADALSNLVETFTRELRRPSDPDAGRAASRALYDILLKPFESELHHVGALTIVPDGVLGGLSFAALRDSSGEFLVEHTTIRYAEFAHTPGDSALVPGRVTVIGNPAFDQTLFPQLEPLRGAQREAEAVDSVYARAMLIEGAAATKANVLAALRASSVVHFAGHAERVPRAPWLSHLVLARSSGGYTDNTLTAGEVRSEDLRRVALVVLSSCGTTDRRSRRDANEGGLAAAFLAAGARAVVSSSWDIDDDATADLMRALHRNLAAGEPAARALRHAQLEMLHSGGTQSPRVWAAFRVEAH